MVHYTGDAMNEIISDFQKVAELVVSIADASTAQSVAVEQITKSISKMDEMTQHNSALVEQSTAATKSLEEQAYNLIHAISMFKTAA